MNGRAYVRGCVDRIQEAAYIRGDIVSRYGNAQIDAVWRDNINKKRNRHRAEHHKAQL